MEPSTAGRMTEESAENVTLFLSEGTPRNNATDSTEEQDISLSYTMSIIYYAISVVGESPFLFCLQWLLVSFAVSN